MMNKAKNCFYVALFLGVGWFVLIASTDMPEALQLSGVLIVAFYGSVVWAKFRRVSGAVDSIYYLGFIFTLCALCSAILPNVFSQVIIDPGKVLSSFSIALATTIVGLIFRTVLVQFETEESLDAPTAQARLVDTSREFSMQLRFVTAEISNVKDELKFTFESFASTLQESSRTAIANCLKTLKEASDEMKKSSKEYSSAMQRGARAIDSSVNKARDSVVCTTNEFASSLENIVDFTNKLRLAAEELGNSTSLINSGVSKELDKLLHSLTQGINTNIKTLVHTSDNAFNQMAINTRNQMEGLHKTMPNFDAIASSLNTIVDTLNEYTLSIGKSTAVAKKGFMNTGAMAQKIVQLNDSIDSFSENISGFIDLSDVIKTLTENIREGANQAKLAYTQSSQRMEERLLDMNKYLEKVKEISEHYVGEAEQARLVNEELSRAVLTSTKMVAESLNPGSSSYEFNDVKTW